MADITRAKIKNDGTTEVADSRPSSAAAFAAVAPQSSSSNPLLSAKPEPVKRPVYDETAAAASDDADEDEVDTVTTASTSKSDSKLVKLQRAEKSEKVAKAEKAERGPSGWVVQIGISSSKDGATDLLDTAKSKGGKALRSAKPYAVAFDGGYRARFGGFEGQSEALSACKALKRAGVKCWASME